MPILILALLFFYLPTHWAYALPINLRNRVELTATTTPAIGLNLNFEREYLLIQNKGSVAIVLQFVNAPADSTDGIIIPAGGNYEPIHPPVDKFYIRSQSATSATEIIEGY